MLGLIYHQTLINGAPLRALLVICLNKCQMLNKSYYHLIYNVIGMYDNYYV